MQTLEVREMRLTVRNETIYVNGEYRGSYDERNGTLCVDGREMRLPMPACMGSRTVGVSAAMVRQAVRETMTELLERELEFANS